MTDTDYRNPSVPPRWEQWDVGVKQDGTNRVAHKKQTWYNRDNNAGWSSQVSSSDSYSGGRGFESRPCYQQHTRIYTS